MQCRHFEKIGGGGQNDLEKKYPDNSIKTIRASVSVRFSFIYQTTETI